MTSEEGPKPAASDRAASLSPGQIALLQRRLAARKAQRATTIADPADAAPRLSFGQERLWLIDQVQPGNPAYNVPVVLPLDATLDPAVLQRALEEVVRRHAVLRTGFVFRDDRVRPELREDTAVPIDVRTLSPVAGESVEEALSQLCTTVIRRPFSLSDGPLLRATLIRVDHPEPGYRLVLVLHHIVCDAWSLGLLVEELQTLYAAFAAGAPSPLAELPVQYADFAAWQRARLDSVACDRLVQHWTDRLADAPPVLDLPSDRPRPLHRSPLGGSHQVALEATTARTLAAIGAARGCTAFVTGLSLFAVLLQRYAGTDDLVIGTPVALRDKPEHERLIGFFLNTLAVRIRLERIETFGDLLDQVRATFFDALAHKDLPFEMLVNASKTQRAANASPLFQVMFSLQNKPQGGAVGGSGGGSDHAPPVIDTGFSRFDLSLSVVETEQSFEGTFEYSRDLFDEATIVRMGSHWQALAKSIAENPERRLREIELLTEEERNQRAAWNATHVPRDAGGCIHHIFAGHVRRTPRAEALSSATEGLTYAEVDSRANRLAWHLRACGTGPEHIVGLMMRRGPDAIIAVLAVLKAGAAYLPLDPDYPAARRAFMVEDAGAKLVLTQSALADLVPLAARPVFVDDDEARFARYPESAPPDDVLPDNAAYVIYTSGSTGLPKGVVVPHRGAVNAAMVEADVLAIHPGDRILQFASLNFDASMYEMLMWMAGGASLVVATAEASMPGLALLDTVRAQCVTVLSLPPSALAVLPVEPLPDLRLITVMGEACPPDLVARWRGVVPRVFNAYGPTEASMWVAGTDLDGLRPTTIGRPIANTWIHLLDRDLNRVPVGVTGELYIGGTAVTRGYLRRAALTAERFIPDPFGEGAGAGGRLYRTGDLARYLADGEIEYLGRGDDQVKVRGFRVELGEVEAALCRHPAVRHAVALVVDQPSGGRTIVAHVAVGTARVAEATLRHFVRQTLPAHAVPSRIALHADLPLTENGKVARKQLAAFDLSPRDAGEGGRGTVIGTETEETIATVWRTVLNLETVGLDDNFFEVGGHSLAAAQIGARLRDALGGEVTVGDILQAMTIRSIAALIDARRGSAPDVSPPAAPDPAETRIARAPLSHGQEQLWFLAQIEPDSATYNIPTGMSLPAPVDETALRRALDEVVHRHEPLRTVFEAVRGEPVQVIHAELTLPLARTDLRDLPGEEGARRLAQLAAQEANTPFDLRRGPLLRAHLVLIDGAWACLLLTIHHIAADGWSVGLLTGELAAAYHAFSTGQPSPLPETGGRYRDFVTWQRSRLAGPEAAPLLHYWRAQLAGAPVLTLPHDGPRARRTGAAGGQHRFSIDATLAERIGQIAVDENSTPFVVFAAAFAILLRRYAQQEDIVFGTPVANRVRAQDEGLIGLFVNALALRTDLSRDPSFRGVIGRMRATVLGALAHQELPFERLVADLAPERVEGANPVFQVFFAYLAQAGGNAGTAADALVASSKFDLSLHLLGTDDGVAGGIEFDPSLFQPATVARLAATFVAVLEAVVADPDAPLSMLSLVPPEEQRQRALWNATEMAWDRSGSLHALIVAQAARTPDLPAVLLDGERLTYADLLERATTVAAGFARLGAGPGHRVGIHLERSLELIVALLAVLNTGAAYVPLDPGYPTARLAEMVADAGIVFAVTATDGTALDGCRCVTLTDAASGAWGWTETATPEAATAYILYTSGSTGRPKGVMNAHRGVVNRLLWMQDAYPIGPGDRILQKTPISFDVSVWELFWPLLTGATLVLAQPGGHRDTRYLARVIAEQRITHLHFVPSMLRVFLDDLGDTALPSLRHVYCSGEALPRVVQDRFPKGLAALHNLYGPTEAAIDVTAWTCSAADPWATVPIGRPVANTAIHILDARMAPVPIGAIGELYIGGVQVAQGYWNRPALTAAAFVPDPFAIVPGARLYRTGDLARFLAEGAIDFCGRADRQVKLRGFRIEPGEIEAVLLREPSVGDAIVLCRDAGTEHAVLIAYVCPASGAAIDPGVLSDACSKSLPAHMVPSAFVAIEAIPLTPSGKRDVSALPPPPATKLPDELSDPPTGAIEQAIARIWAEVLHRETIGAHEVFFRLGGQSLQAMRVLARIREGLSVELSAAQFFQAPTVAGLAALVESAGGGTAGLYAAAESTR
ncbi:non-ribosomal peptide synthetase [Sphingomonas sp. PAMC 26617]|uniref:non-ribosomal peptide synthetase n=1 Tax=Sphingomonas sp. PAMC 26617 TaxID=1112216 RepID=UPI000289EE10|nr:non-ribosomal peptide synthetase [Sphingomonas sp. PAMC 26617]